MSEQSGFWSRLRPDTITALSAVVIGVCALAVSFYQTRIMREQQVASVWPRFSVGLMFTGTELAVLVENMGIGPAQIRGVEVLVDGRPVRAWTEVLSQLSRQGTAGASGATLSNRVIPAGQTVEALRLREPEQAREAAGAFGRLQMRICYCSVYEDCWMLEQGLGARIAEAPEEVDRCSAESDRSFTD